MPHVSGAGWLAPILAFTALSGFTDASAAPAPERGDIPEHFAPKTDTFDYVRREEMIPMRDGVKLKTFILIPKGAREAPLLLTRTPYIESPLPLRMTMDETGWRT